MKMSRESREIKNYLEAKSGAAMPPFDLFELESLTYSFFPKFIKGAIDRYYNPKSKNDPTSISFYAKPIKSLKKAMKDGCGIWEMDEQARDIIWNISHYLLEDYNADQQKIVKQITEQFTKSQVIRGIEIAKQEKVFNVNFLFRVIEGVKARDEYEQDKIAKRRDMFIEGAEDRQAVKRSKMDLALLMADWQEAIENVEINRKLKELEESNNGNNR